MHKHIIDDDRSNRTKLRCHDNGGYRFPYPSCLRWGSENTAFEIDSFGSKAASNLKSCANPWAPACRIRACMCSRLPTHSKSSITIWKHALSPLSNLQIHSSTPSILVDSANSGRPRALTKSALLNTGHSHREHPVEMPFAQSITHPRLSDRRTSLKISRVSYQTSAAASGSICSFAFA